MRKPSPSLVILAVVAIAFAWSQVEAALRQADTQRAVDATQRAVDANCVVVSVLLGNRADRDETIKLFDPIRRENPQQFDKLVRRAERGDEQLAAVQGDLACVVEQAPPVNESPTRTVPIGPH